MTAIPQAAVNPGQEISRPVSRRLTGPLGMVAGRARVLGFLRASFQLLVLTGSAWLVIVLTLGTLRAIPAIGAVALALAAWAVLVLGAMRFFGRSRILRRESLATSARRVDAALPATQERISSAVEISQETDGRFRGSPELVACLIRQAEKDADKLDPNLVVSGTSVLRWCGLLLPILAAWIILLAVKGPLLAAGLQRTLKPWAALPALPQAILRIDPGNVTVAQGTEVEIRLVVEPAPSSAPDADNSPDRATITRRFITGSADQASTSEMQPTAVHAFRATVPNVDQSFTYHVNSCGVQSPTYTVTVQSRPAVAKLQVAYEFPGYTGLAARTDPSRDGAIDALIGTKVTLTVDSTQPLKTAQLEIADNAPHSALVELHPQQPGSKNYVGEFTVIRSTQYKIKLVNSLGLENADNQPRPILARADAPPQITISSPVGIVKVRPDDTVNVAYEAVDDFGVAKVEALVQVDELPAKTIGLVLANTPAPPKIPGKWPLSVAAMVRDIPGGRDARKITYQLRATDNCRPDAQTGLSARQVLEIDKGVAPLAQRLDSDAVKVLAEAIKKAAAELQEATRNLKAVQKADVSKPLDEAENQKAADARERVAQARKNLNDASEKARDTRLATEAREAKDIAENPLRQAEEKTADTQLAADKAQQRNESAADAQKNIDEAQRRLGALAQDLAKKSRQQPLAQSLERIADRQKQLADAMQRHPGDPALKQQQKDLQKQVEKLIQENPDLQKPAEDANQSAKNALVQKIQSLEQNQQSLEQHVKNQAQPGTQATRDAESLQQAAQKLGEQIEQAKKDHNPPTRPSDPANQEAQRLAGELKRQALQMGLTPEAKKSADSARQEASKGNAPAAQQRLMEGAQQLADGAKTAARSKGTLLQEKEQSEESARQAGEMSRQIEQVRQQAQSLQQQTKGGAPEMSDRAFKAAQALQQAANNQRQAAKDAQPSGASQAAAQQEQSADNLATAEESLTGQPSAFRRAIPPPRQPDPQQQLASGQKSPEQNQQNGSNESPPQKPTPNQNGPQQPNQNGQPGGKAGAQNGSSQKNGTGQGQPSGQMAGASGSAGSQGSGSQTAGAQGPGSQGAGSQGAKDSGSQTAGAQRSGSQGSQGSGSQSAGGQSSGSHGAGSQGSGSPSAGAPGAGSSAPAAGQSNSGNQSATNTQGTGQGQGQAHAGQRSTQSAGGSGQSPAPGQSTAPGQPGSGQGTAGPGGSTATSTPGGGSEGGQKTPGVQRPPNPQPTAAQSIQSARQLQSQAANGDPQAAQKAAEQLSQASQKLGGSGTPPSRSTPTPPNSPTAGAGQNSSANPSPGGAPSPQSASGNPGTPQPGGPGAGSGQPGHQGPGGQSPTGVKLTEGPYAHAPEPPKVVKDIGLSPSDWARLPPNMQQQLLNSAQESGPPSYHEMIKNYYSRIARLQNSGSAP